MAICKISENVTVGCGEYSMAGLSNIYLANFEDVTALTKSTGGTITGISMASGTTFYSYEFGEDTAFFSQPFTNQNGNIAYNASIEFRIPNQNQDIINALSKLDFAKLAVVCRTRNGEYFYFGEYNPLKRTGGENSSGTAATDASGISVILTGGGAAPAAQVLKTAIDAVLA
jgi:hypothetical protein